MSVDRVYREVELACGESLLIKNYVVSIMPDSQSPDGLSVLIEKLPDDGDTSATPASAWEGSVFKPGS